MSGNRFDRLRNAAIWIAVTVTLLELTPRLFSIPDYLFPPLSQVLTEYTSAPAYLLSNAATTFVEALLGLLLVGVAGVTLGATSARRNGLGNVTLRSAAIMQTIPVVAIAPLIIIWAGPGILSKVLMAALVGMPPTLVAAVDGFRSTPSDLINTLRVMGAAEISVTFQVRIPYAISHLSVGLRVSAALCVIGAIVAEYAGSTDGIGYVIMQSSYRLNTSTLFAAVFAAIICGLALVALARGASAAALHLIRWR